MVGDVLFLYGRCDRRLGTTRDAQTDPDQLAPNAVVRIRPTDHGHRFAVQAGTGSLSTTHAESAKRAVGKLVTCAMKAGAHVTEQYATRAIAESLNIIVHVDARVEVRNGHSFKRRWTSEIVVLEPGEKEKGYSLTAVFACPQGSTRISAVSGMPEAYRGLVAHGFDLGGYLAESQRAAS